MSRVITKATFGSEALIRGRRRSAYLRDGVYKRKCVNAEDASNI